MNLLVTAGNTLVPIDRVRCITNVFTGRTGARIALQGYERGHRVTLLTSHPEVLPELTGSRTPESGRWTVLPYRTFDELEALMQDHVRRGQPASLIHCAAVSDYRAAGVYAPAATTRFRADGHWESLAPELPKMLDRTAGKVKSDEPELWLRLTRTPKLVDRVREPWGYAGILVKFKLEVDVGDAQLLDTAETSRRQSRADLMVANTLEAADSWAYLGPVGGGYERVPRPLLAERLLLEIERLHAERGHG